MARQQHRRRALGAIAEQGGRRRPFLAGAQHIGGADIAGADLAHIARARDPGEEQAERNRAQQIAERQGGKRCSEGQGRGHRDRTMTGFQAKIYGARRTRIRRRQRSCCARPWNLRPSKAVLRARECSLSRIHHKGLVRRPAAPDRRARPWPACRRQARRCAPARRSWRRSAYGKAGAAFMMTGCSAAGSSVSSPTAPNGGGGERLALGVGALRFMAGDDHVDRARGDAFHHGGAVGFASAAAASPCGRCNRSRHPARSAPDDGRRRRR